MVLSKLIINNQEIYHKSKELVKKEYFLIHKNASRLLISDDFIVETNGLDLGTLERRNFLEKIILTFKELEIINELRKN